jgi:hypothetical protein
LAKLRLIDVVAPDDVLRHGLWIAGMQQFLDDRFVALSCIGLELIAGRTKPGAAQQMCHESDLLLGHAPASSHTCMY